MKLNKAHKELLKSVVDGTKSAGFTYVNANDVKVKSLVDAGLIEVNPAVVDASTGNVAARATASALATEPVAAVVKTKTTYEIASGIIPAVAKRGGIREEQYPFSQLEVGQSFFIPSTEKKPNPAESFASTVTSAMRRFAVETGNKRTNRKGVEVMETKPTRKFVIRAVKAGQTYANSTFVESADGARIFRTE